MTVLDCLAPHRVIVSLSSPRNAISLTSLPACICNHSILSHSSQAVSRRFLFALFSVAVTLARSYGLSFVVYLDLCAFVELMNEEGGAVMALFGAFFSFKFRLVWETVKRKIDCPIADT
uniref:Uncharacterized protein n=1 Tax=Trypanosoma vivax (strain Y486) TaxID=1055687 RepID=G0TSZ7_TRYVY|nr:hypothetical protein TVY486_0302640 [Trypanosoma vivax Y486]